MANQRWQKKYFKKTDNGLLSVRPGCRLQVRFVGDPVKIVRIFTSDDKCITVKNEDTACELKEKYPTKIKNISVRYSCWCFDRHDDRLKVLDMPKSVVCAISKYAESRAKKISDAEEGCDWKITTNGERGIDVRYKVSYVEETYLTDRERNIVEDRKLDKKRPYDLTKMYPSCSYLEAEYKLATQCSDAVVF